MALRSLNGYYVLSRESAKNFNFEESAKKFMAFMKDFTPMDASTDSALTKHTDEHHKE
ncbi:hypothetical protein [Bifidobacterium panos]|uniref:Uncharacterized protein n=1 Tax=Bifidobacterium panos TaxID=2675321 RepID=A0ABX1SXC1_9BIFI|nr:hypothetical protein [Bifidobacterium sp. DSM 109963]NMN02465.1 hypothetical protein [Bifidobacterium sp. DSM 109963]